MSQELCRRLRQDARSSHHGRSAHEAATLIEQQAARIAVLEQQAWCGGTEAKTVRATRDEPSSPACAPCKAPGGTCFPEPCGRYQQRRAEAAEAEVKRLREALEDFLRREGYRRCDIAACNCGSWHGGHAANRLRELSELIGQNGKTLIDSAETLLRRAEAAEAEVKRLRKALEEISNGTNMEAGEMMHIAHITLSTQGPRHD